MKKIKPTEQEILKFLTKIEMKEITISIIIDPLRIYSSTILYKASNGWEITIFNDSESWDYIDNIKINEGVVLKFDELDNMLKIRNYEPPLKIIKEVYRIEQENERG